MHLFYAPDIENSLFHELSRDESHHAIKVLRMHKGERIHLTDGKGNLFTAEIIEPNPVKCYVGVKEMKARAEKKSYYLHIALAPPKNIDRFEFFLEKAAETGVDEITPLSAERSERKLVNHERMNKILISAMKQSGRCFKVHLNKITPFNELIKQCSSSAMEKFIAVCSQDKNKMLHHAITKRSKCVILIGPEGDFTSTETLAAVKAGFQAVSLGDYRLRTETAGVMAVMAVYLGNY